MKLNTILMVALIGLISFTFLIFVDEKPDESRANYLLNPMVEVDWSLELNNGTLKKRKEGYFWKGKQIPGNDEDLAKVIASISDLRIMRVTDDISWDKENEVQSFGYNGKQFSVSKLNSLTGRFMVFEKQIRKIYIIEDLSPLQELHKSFEVGQKIKYYNFINLVKHQTWDL